MKKHCPLRFLAATLAGFLLLSSLVVFPASAAYSDINSDTLDDISWSLDLEKMEHPKDNLGHPDYTLSANTSTAVLTDFQGERVIAYEDTRGDFRIVDTNCLLGNHETFIVSVDMFFKQFPYGPKSDDEPDVTANDYPVSLIAWLTKTTPESNYSFKAVRIDSEGYICTGATSGARTATQLPLNEWVNLRLAVSRTNGNYELYVNGELVLSSKFNTAKSYCESIIRFLDGYYHYTAYLKNLEVYTNNSYKVGVSSEISANYTAYQTTKPQNNKFDVRLISSLDSLDYNRSGFEVTAITKNGDDVTANIYSVANKKVYTALNAADATVSAADLGAAYLSTITVPDLDLNADRIELAIRPYVSTLLGGRIYGKAKLLVWTGDMKDGHPAFYIPERVSSYILEASEDTIVRLRAGDNPHGADADLNIKNNGPDGSNTRIGFFKFEFNEVGTERLLEADRVFLEFYVTSARDMTEEEAANGGLLGRLSATKTDWDEDTLTMSNYLTDAAVTEEICDFRFYAGGYTSIDITDYLLMYAGDSVFSFRFDNVENDGEGNIKIGSTDSSNPPRLVIYPLLYNHELELDKSGNEGYEPWSYAEELVAQWNNGGRDELYSFEPYEVPSTTSVDNTTANGDYTYKSPYKMNHISAIARPDIYLRTVDTITGYNAKSTVAPIYDEYGGVTNAGVKGEATGFFHVETIGGRSYIISPLGNPYIAVGMNTVSLGATAAQKQAALAAYGTEENFYKSISHKLSDLGINTIYTTEEWRELLATKNLNAVVSTGGMSEYMSALGLIQSNSGEYYMHNNTMNIFDPDFIPFTEKQIKKAVAGYENDPRILGWTSDNELPAQDDLLFDYLTIDPSDPRNAFSYAVAWTYLMDATGLANPSVDDITDEMSEDFKAFVYSRYYSIIKDSLNKAGVKQMYLGSRIHSGNRESEGCLRAASMYVDLLTVNLYGGPTPDLNMIEYMYKYTGKPFIVTEFYAKGMNALDMNGIPLMNQKNAGWVVESQADRGAHYESYALRLLESNMCVGWTWYRFRDNDQRVYADSEGNLYVDYEITNGTITSYIRVGTLADDGSFMINEDLLNVTYSSASDPYAPFVTNGVSSDNLSVIYSGEHGGDGSNNGSNKGLYDNKMNIYQALADSFAKISKNLFGLIQYFDNQ